MNQITLWEDEHGKYCGSAPQPARRQHPTHLERDQLIWKNNKEERLTSNIMRWLFPLLVWNRVRSSLCGEGPAHYHVEKGQLIIVWRRASSSSCGEGPAHHRVEKGQVIIVWRRAVWSPCGEGPAHHRVEKGQLIWKIVKEKIFEKA